MLNLGMLWLGIAAGYGVAAALIVGGGYLAFFLGATIRFAGILRYIGLVMIGAGLVLASLNYGKSLGASDCEAEWKAKSYEAQIARLQQEAAAKQLAAKLAADQAAQLASQNDDQQRQIFDYEASSARLSKDLAACRRASGDDDRRLCVITGNAADGCQHSR